MEKYKLIACDLDGTLVDSEGRISEENRRAIGRLAERGIYFVPCTGRTVCEMEDIVAYPEIRYVIYSNGAAILDKKENKNIFMGLSKENLKAALDAVFSFDSYIICHCDGKSYVDFRLKDKAEEYNVPGNVTHLLEFALYEKSFREFAYSLENVECLCVFFKNKDEQYKCRKLLEENKALHIVQCYNSNLEIFSSGAGKGSALEILAAKLEIPLSETVAVGDSGNDISMIKKAGLGISVSNACEELKEASDVTVCSNNESAVSYIEEVVL